VNKRILALTSASHGVNHMYWEVLGPLLPFLIISFDLSHTQAGRLGFIYSLIYGLMNYPSGHLSDKYGPRNFIFLFLIITSLSIFLIIFAKSYLQLLILFALAGLGGGLYHSPGTALLSNNYPKEKRGMALGFHASVGSLGTLLAFVFVGVIATRWNWEIAIISICSVGLGLALCFRLFLWDVGSNTEGLNLNDTSSDKTKVHIWTLTKGLSWMLLLYGFVMFLFKGAYVWVPTYLKETYDLSTGKAIAFSVILPTIGIFSNFLIGRFSDSFGRKRSLVFIFLIISVCFFLFFVSCRALLIPLLIIFGFFINSFSGVINAYTRDLLPPEIMGKAFGIIFTFSICVSAFSPYAMGIISDRSSLSGSMLFMSVIALIGAVTSLKIPKRVVFST